jgi:tetratricopeptide (TPR) repeat protein
VAVLVAASTATGVARAQPAPASDAPAASDEDVARARRHFEAGEAYFAELRYDDAAREFTEAWQISQRPEMLFNISIAYERGLRFDEAIAAIEQYIPLAAAADRPQAERRLARLRELRERQRSQRAGDTPEGPDPEPDDAEPMAIGDRPPADDRGGDGSSTGAWIVIGAGAAAGVGALITGLIAHGTYSDLDAACPSHRGCDPALQDDRDSASTMAWVSTVLTGVAVVAAAVGVTLLVAF